MIDTTRHHRMIDAFKKSHGEEVAMALADSLDFTDLATKADLESVRIATKADLESLRIATKADLENLRIATKADLKSIDTRLDGIDTRLDTCATTADLQREMNKQLRWMMTSLVAFFGANAGVLTLVLRAAA